MSLLESNHISASELADVTLVVKVGVLLSAVSNLGTELANSSLRAENHSLLAGSSLNVVNELEESLGVKRTRLNVCSVEVVGVGSDACESSVCSGNDVLVECLSNAVNELVEVDTASEESAEVLVNADNLHLGRNLNGVATNDSLTTNALNAVCNGSNDKVCVALNVKLSDIALSDVSVVNESKERIALSLDTLFDNYRKKLLSNCEERSALVEGLRGNLCGTAVELDESVAESIGSVSRSVIAHRTASDGVDGNCENILIHNHLSPFLKLIRQRRG